MTPFSAAAMLVGETTVEEDVQPFKIETILEQDGSLTLRSLPFRAGERVEVIVRSQSQSADTQKDYPLWGTAYRYDDPTEPVAEANWESTR